jgi:hypothetical protein
LKTRQAIPADLLPLFKVKITLELYLTGFLKRIFLRKNAKYRAFCGEYKEKPCPVYRFSIKDARALRNLHELTCAPPSDRLPIGPAQYAENEVGAFAREVPFR